MFNTLASRCVPGSMPSFSMAVGLRSPSEIDRFSLPIPVSLDSMATETPQDSVTKREIFDQLL